MPPMPTVTGAGSTRILEGELPEPGTASGFEAELEALGTGIVRCEPHLDLEAPLLQLGSKPLKVLLGNR